MKTETSVRSSGTNFFLIFEIEHESISSLFFPILKSSMALENLKKTILHVIITRNLKTAISFRST